MAEAKAPTMNRSRGQLASAYAPHSLFTFEGGAGACMARPSPTRAYEPTSGATKRLIYEQIVEYCESWLQRATSGRETVVPVVPQRALDGRILRGGSVDLPLGLLHFQIPDRVAYVPFPPAFTCTHCELYRSCANECDIAAEAESFRKACPRGPSQCRDDWQQLDVVMAHWSGAVEMVTPLQRYVADDLNVRGSSSCRSCGGDRYYLRRRGSAFAQWRFECVDCGTGRELRLEDRETLELLKQDLVNGQNLRPQINMEPISYRASAVFYPHGDRVLVFGDDRWLVLLQSSNAAELGRFLGAHYGFPVATLSDLERERMLRDAGRGSEWENYVAARAMLASLQGQPPAALRFLQQNLISQEATWNETVFAGQTPVAAGIASAIECRQQFVRRFDPVRMAVEHKTLIEERVRAGATLPDGRLLSVDVTRPDAAMLPDRLSGPDARADLEREVALRLRLLGIAEMRLLRGLQICEYTFAYTRTSATPLVEREKAGRAQMPVRLRLFDKVRISDVMYHPVLCLEQSNEAFYIRLDEDAVAEWLLRNGMPQSVGEGLPRLGGRLIEAYSASPFSRFLDEYRKEQGRPRTAYPFAYTLLHTVAHHFITVAAAMSGLDFGSFGEHIFAPDLALIVYRRGMTMDLGNLSSMWRDRGSATVGNEVLDKMVARESLRCGSESVCSHHGGACPDCILIPETACLTRNELLSRSALVGRGVPRWSDDVTPLAGFYTTAAELHRAKH